MSCTRPRRWLVALVLGWLHASAAWSWSAPGHGEIAVAALEALPPSERVAYDEILAAGPWRKGAWREQAAAASVWPDRVRDTPLRKLFEAHGSGRVPEPLRPYARQTTSDWHYVNALFIAADGRLLEPSAGLQCPPPQTGKLFEIWPVLLSSFAQIDDARDRALLLAFILHMGADAYQPLHVLSALNPQCVSDRGGNGYCVAPPTGLQRPQGRCQMNLHRIWDQGFEVFGTERQWQRERKALARDHRDLHQVTDVLRPVARQIYPNTAQHASSATYQRASRAQVMLMANLAADHLFTTLQALAEPQQNMPTP